MAKPGRPTSQPKSVVMNISLSQDQRERLEAESDKTGKSMAELIRQAVDQFLCS